MKLLETIESAPPGLLQGCRCMVEEIYEAVERKIGHGNIAGSVRSGLLLRFHGKIPENSLFTLNFDKNKNKSYDFCQLSVNDAIH